MAQLKRVSTIYVQNHEPWLCRAVEAGYFMPQAVVPGAAPTDVYVSALLVAMLQMVGGVSTILPTNVAEFGWFFGTVLAGTVLFAAVQGVVCGVVTTGDPDEIAWRQNYGVRALLPTALAETALAYTALACTALAYSSAHRRLPYLLPCPHTLIPPYPPCACPPSTPCMQTLSTL